MARGKETQHDPARQVGRGRWEESSHQFDEFGDVSDEGPGSSYGREELPDGRIRLTRGVASAEGREGESEEAVAKQLKGAEDVSRMLGEKLLKF